MEYKRTMPVLSDSKSEDSEKILSYVEDLKAETAVRISTLENTIELIKDKLAAATEVST